MSQQTECMDRLDLFVRSDNLAFRLSGFSGTGKTYTICKYLKYYLDANPDAKVAAIALPNKAVTNLKRALQSFGVTRVDCATTAQFLGLRPVLDAVSGKESFEEGDSNLRQFHPEDYDLVIVDEYSMINKEQILTINSKCQKIIYVGDPAQLPPIGEQLSHVCNMECDGYLLTETVRYEGDLARVAESWRDPLASALLKSGSEIKVHVVSVRKPLPIDETMDGSIIRFKKLEWLNHFVAATKYSIETDNLYGCRILTFTNKCADKWNAWVHSELWDNDLPYQIGDRLVAKKPLFRADPVSGKMGIVAPNSIDLIICGEYLIEEVCIEGCFLHYFSIPTITDDGLRFQAWILTEDSRKKRDARLNEIATEAKTLSGRDRSFAWRRYYDLQQTFDDLTYSYAITTHKSQGSTYDAVYPDIANMSQCPEKMRIIYTGITRSKQVYIFQ